MNNDNVKTSKLNIALTTAISLFVLLSASWVVLRVSNPETDGPALLFGATYGLMALFGGIYGLLNAKKWGGWKSTLGRTLVYLSLGLLFAEFGQLVFSYYNIIKSVEIPYPSLADVGFFGSIPFYILGAFALTKVTGLHAKIGKTFKKQLVFAVLPLILLIVSYMIFLRGYSFTDTPKLTIFLDFGYPLGQALYVGLALVILLTTGNALGGVMKSRVLLLLAAFVAQYAADFNFLYQNLHDTWQNGGYGDYLYLIAYFMMTLSLIHMMTVFKSPKIAPVTVAPEVTHE